MSITHQNIADRVAELDEFEEKAKIVAQEKFKAERLSLQELCGSIGHVYTPVAPASWRLKSSFTQRVCSVCNKGE